jgi:hypothetical protein
VKIAELSRAHPDSSQSAFGPPQRNLKIAKRKDRGWDMCSRARFESTRSGDGLMQLWWLRSGIRKAKTAHKMRGSAEAVAWTNRNRDCFVERRKLGRLATENEAKVQVQYPVLATRRYALFRKPAELEC